MVQYRTRYGLYKCQISKKMLTSVFDVFIAPYSQKVRRYFLLAISGSSNIVHASFIPRLVSVQLFISEIGILASMETEIFTGFPSLIGVNAKQARLSTSNTEIGGKTHQFCFDMGGILRDENQKTELYQEPQGFKEKIRGHVINSIQCHQISVKV